MLLLVDFDGTLVDTLPDIHAQADRVLTEAGFPSVGRDAVARAIGHGPATLFGKLAGPEQAETLAARFNEAYPHHLVDLSRPFPGVVEALEKIDAPKAVVTNKSQAHTEAILRRLDLARLFCAVYGAEAFPRRKPDPLPLLEACRLAGVPPARAWMIGDGLPDAQAAKAAGCRFGLALWGYGDMAALRALAPDALLNSPAELSRALRSRRRSDSTKARAAARPSRERRS